MYKKCTNKLFKKSAGRYIDSPSMSKKIFSYFFSIIILISSCKKFENVEDAEGKSSPNATADVGTQMTSLGTGPDFMIAVIPDTQYYTSEQNGGTMAMFTSQINWIKSNRVDSNIVYVIGLGDIVDHGNDVANEWVRASNAYYSLETPATGLPNGIPYGLAVGNHDQTPYGQPLTGTTTKFNQYFGRSHFAGRTYYGGNMAGSGSNSNDSHYDLFSAGGTDFIVIYIEYDNDIPYEDTNGNMNTWAYNLLGTYSNRKAIIVSHTAIVNSGDFSDQGRRIYDRLKSRKNVFLMLNGHHAGHGEAFRRDTYNGQTIKTYLSDYQARFDGGNGKMRLMKFSTNNDLLTTITYSPFNNIYEVDSNSVYVHPLFRSYTTSRKEDFDNDGETELGFFNAGTWKIDGMSNISYGAAGDFPVPNDYNGDGRTERAVFRPITSGGTGNGSWHIVGLSPINWGALIGDIPVPADYNGDGRADIAIFRPMNAQGTGDGNWYIKDQATIYWGALIGDIPVPADYNGDGKVDIAIFRPINAQGTGDGKWYIKDQSTIYWGALIGDIPVPSDYSGDGITDICVYRPATGVWHVRGVNTYGPLLTPFAGDIPAPGDYFGAGKIQPAIYRPSNNTLYMYNNGTVTTKVMGASGDKILNLPYHIRKFFFP